MTIASSAGMATMMAALILTSDLQGTSHPVVSTHPGCEPFNGEVSESSEFTAWEDRRSHLPELPISVFGGPLDVVPNGALVETNVIDGHRLRWAINPDGGALYLYFLDRPIDQGLTVNAFFTAGGILMAQERTLADEQAVEHADELTSALHSRSTTLQVGAHAATLTWADPMRNGTRTHNVYWSGGGLTYSLIADRSPDVLINLARSIVCAHEHPDEARAERR